MQTAAQLGVLGSLERNAEGAGALAGAAMQVGSASPSLALGNVADPGRGVDSQPYKQSPSAAQSDPSHHGPCAASVVPPP